MTQQGTTVDAVQQRIDRIDDIAREMVTKVRDEAPRDVWRWLRNAVADLGSADPIDDWVALCVAQACATPDDQNWDQLTEWVRLREFGDGRPDTPEKIALRRAALDQALNPDSYRSRSTLGAA